jgi:catechol-2,3-dioxygenase
MSHIVGISEIVLWTADKTAAFAFYHDLLGFQQISPVEMPNIFLKISEGHAGIPQMLVLVPKPADIAAKPFGYQLHHLAFELPADKFDAQRQALVTAGYEPRGGVHPVLASRTMYVDDPDGNEVEFICHLPSKE